MSDQGVLEYEETTGKGGHRRIYSARLDEMGLQEGLSQGGHRSLLRDFPGDDGDDP